MNRLFDKLPFIGKRIPGKITLSFFMLVFAIIMFVSHHSFDRTICLFAMLFSFFGDIFLNHNKYDNNKNAKNFILGGIAFILAHICYCIAYGYKLLLNNFVLLNFGFIFSIFIIILLTIIFIISSKTKNALFIFGIIYLCLTGINYSTVFSYAYSAMSIESISALGGLLFLISDVIIGFEKFCGLKSKIARELVWWLYPIGQIILIAMA